MSKKNKADSDKSIEVQTTQHDYAELQTRLEEQLIEVNEVQGVGLSYNKKTKGPAFKVFLSDINKADDLPNTIEKIDIEYEQAEDIDAYDK